MKLSTIVLATLVTATATMANASDKQFYSSDNYVTSNICVTALEGNRVKLNKQLKEARLDKKTVVDNVKCNNQDFLTFVEQNGNNADKIIRMMDKNAERQNVSITDLAAR